MSAEQMREEFEAWAVSRRFAVDRDKYLNGMPYTSVWTTGAWEAWQAALSTQPQAPQGAVTDPTFKGPAKWTNEEVADGHKGIRWITTEGVHGRPTSHDLMGYLQSRGKEAYCDCLECKAFFAAPETPEGKK